MCFCDCMISVQNQIILKQVVVPSLGFGSCSGGNNDFEALSISSLDVLKSVIFTLKCNGAYGDASDHYNRNYNEACNIEVFPIFTNKFL